MTTSDSAINRILTTYESTDAGPEPHSITTDSTLTSEHREYPCEFWAYSLHLRPYVATRAITDDQIREAIAAGITTDEIRNRLVSAECAIYDSFVATSWESGWHSAVDSIATIGRDDDDTGFDDDDTGFGGLLEAAENRRQTLRQACYTGFLNGSVTTWPTQVLWRCETELQGPEWTGQAAYSFCCGEADCLTDAMLFVGDRYEENDWLEIASVLKSTTDRTELRELAARQRAIDAAQTLHGIWTPYGYVRHDQIGGI